MCLENLQTPKEEALPLVVRPPYGLNESLFQSECVICESKACVASCDEEIILIRGDGTPMLKFAKSGCTFCEDCASACEPNVLSLEITCILQNNSMRHFVSLQKAVWHIMV